MKAIYLDYMATTPLDKDVLAAMLPYFTQCYGNANALHSYGREASAAVEQARATIAQSLHTKPEQLIFTSGATEANNLAVFGLAARLPQDKRHLVTLATEHASVLEPYKKLASQGYSVTFVKPQPNGLVDKQDFARAMTKQTGLVSLLWANNEIGVIQNLAELIPIARQYGVHIHIDAVQALGKMPIMLDTLDVDTVVFSGHKVYGPKGIGLLYIGEKVQDHIEPLMLGGKQERGLRPGTVAVPLIVGFAKALEMAVNRQAEDTAHALRVRDAFLQELAPLSDWTVHGDLHARIPHNLNICFKGIDHETLRLAVPTLAFSAGSACAMGQMKPSATLRALDVSVRDALCSVRFSFGRQSTVDEAKEASACLVKAVQALRFAQSQILA